MKDKWGIPALRFHYKFGDNEHRMAEDMKETAQEMFEEVGFNIVHVNAESSETAVQRASGTNGSEWETVALPAIIFKWRQPRGLVRTEFGRGCGSVLDVRSHCIIARAALLSGAFVAMKSIQVNHDLIESGRIVAPGS